MKEPVPNWCGLCKWRGVTVSKSTIDTMKLIGYLWNDRLDAYELVNPIKETPVPLSPISFEVDTFHHAVYKPYGGDCRRVKCPKCNDTGVLHYDIHPDEDGAVLCDCQVRT